MTTTRITDYFKKRDYGIYVQGEGVGIIRAALELYGYEKTYDEVADGYDYYMENKFGIKKDIFLSSVEHKGEYFFSSSINHEEILKELGLWT